MLIYAWIKNLSYSKQIQELLEQNNYSKEKFMSKNVIFYKMAFGKFINRMNGGYEMIMEIKLWKSNASIKQKFYCFEDFTNYWPFSV